MKGAPDPWMSDAERGRWGMPGGKGKTVSREKNGASSGPRGLRSNREETRADGDPYNLP